jgi:hypothetical protein
MFVCFVADLDDTPKFLPLEWNLPLMHGCFPWLCCNSLKYNHVMYIDNAMVR